MPTPIPDELEQIAKDVVDAAIKLHIALGPGLLESVYSVLLAKKLTERGYRVEREKKCHFASQTVPLICDSNSTSW